LTQLGYMGCDNMGNTFHGLTHPRKDLMERLGYRSAQKMYCDITSGGSRHIGYVVGPHWVRVYRVSAFKH